MAKDNSNKSEYATMNFSYWTYNTTRAKTSKINIPDINGFEWFSVEITDEAAANYEKIYKQEYDFFYAYLTALYGEPSFRLDGGKSLLEKYNKRFSYNKEHYSPVLIWDTSTSYISIIQCDTIVGGIKYGGAPIVIAQPRK